MERSGREPQIGGVGSDKGISCLYGEGVAPDPVEIVEYDDNWPVAFEAAAGEIREVLGAYLIEIEHIGSTAVPELPAKPIIDIQIGVRSLDRTPEIVAALGRLGYEYRPGLETELPNRRYFRRRSPAGVRTHQIHLVERTDHAWWDPHIAFRDWLRDHPTDRDRYAELKRELARRFRHDRVAYTDAKSAFIADVVDRATSGPP